MSIVLKMPSAEIRILLLLCLGIVIMNVMRGLPNLLYASRSDIKIEVADNDTKNLDDVHFGGRYFPPNGTPQYKVAIIVPYRDRRKHLETFINYMHTFLMKQSIEYGIFVVEQEGSRPFNRGKLMNVGFAETHHWPCFIFHDVDLLPLDQRNLYSCPKQPRHMSASIDLFNFTLPYEDLFGGVSALTVEQFKKVNGFSNRYWGWGGEDDDMAVRLKKMNYHIARYKMSIARYASLNHDKSLSKPNRKRHRLILQAVKTFKEDGLSSLEYVLRDTIYHRLYTRFLVNIDEDQSKLDNIRISFYTNLLFGDKW